jgi:hypothetical protein
MTAIRDRRCFLFGAVAMLMLTVEAAVTRSIAFQRGGAVPVAVFVDLMVVLPLLFGLVVLRPTKRPALDVAPVLALGALVSGVLLASRPETKTLLRVSGALTELAVMALLVRRLRVGARELQGAEGDDFLMRASALTDPVLRLLAVELTVVYYAFLGPRLRRPLREGELSYHEKSGLGGLLFALGLVAVMEGLGVHLVLHPWSPRVAWVLAALNGYLLVWLAAVFQAARLRPVVVTADQLLVRTSLLWTVAVPRASIASVKRLDEMPPGKGILRAALGTAPEILVTLSEPVTARGPLGIRRSVTGIALYLDEPEKLRAALEG